MKKRLFCTLVAALLCLLSLAACSNSSSPSSSGAPPAGGNSVATSNTTPASQPTSGLSPASSPSAVSAASATSADDELKMADGVIADMGMGKYYIQFSDGIAIGVDQQGVETAGLTNTDLGATIRVYYTGTLSTDGGYTILRLETP